MIEKVATLLQVDDLAAAVARWTQILGVEPSFVDGDRWAQFDVAGGRLALAGTDRVGGAGMMLKVDDVDAAHRLVTDAELEPTAISQGGHERRFTVAGESGTLAVYYGR